MQATCKLKYQRYSMLKVARLMDLIRGKNLREAQYLLDAMRTPTKNVVKKAVKSAGANLSVKLGKKIDLKEIWVKEAKADQGPMKFLRRFNAGPQGRAMPYTRNMCHITVTVTDNKE
ncbi:MAG: 50S ribosomal protein L22 [Elusimicrobia bacterium]|nr:50S ribosomal protein L22 [Elusimicrobiota bacterium]